jgi:hypothetical protein
VGRLEGGGAGTPASSLLLLLLADVAAAAAARWARGWWCGHQERLAAELHGHRAWVQEVVSSDDRVYWPRV